MSEQVIEGLAKFLSDDVELRTGLQQIRNGNWSESALWDRVAAKVVATQSAENKRLREALIDVCMDLEEEIRGKYGSEPIHPAMQKRLDRDMEVVIAARAALSRG